MHSFEEKLRHERESRGVTIDEIAEKSQVDRRYLEALERGDFEALPGPAFGKFYVRVYADVLGFEPEPLIAEYDREQRARDPVADPADRSGERPEQLRPVEAQLARWRAARMAERAESEAGVDAEPEPVAEPAEQETAEPEAAEAEPVMAEAADPEPESVEPVAAAPELVAVADRAEPEVSPGEPGEAQPQAGVYGSRHDEAAAVAAVFSTTVEPGANLRSGLLPWIGVAALLLLIVATVLVFLADGTVEESPPAAVDGVVSPPVGQVEDNPREETGPPVDSDAAAARESAAPDDESDRGAPSSEPAGRSAPAGGGLTVDDHGVGRRIVDRALVDRGDRFEEGSIVWFSTRVLGGRAGQRIRHVWLRDRGVVQTIDLRLGGPHWRTHSSKTLWGTGRWRVEARDEAGRVLARTTFTCTPR